MNPHTKVRTMAEPYSLRRGPGVRASGVWGLGREQRCQAAAAAAAAAAGQHGPGSAPPQQQVQSQPPLAVDNHGVADGWPGGLAVGLLGGGRAPCKQPVRAWGCSTHQRCGNWPAPDVSAASEARASSHTFQSGILGPLPAPTRDPNTTVSLSTQAWRPQPGISKGKLSLRSSAAAPGLSPSPTLAWNRAHTMRQAVPNRARPLKLLALALVAAAAVAAQPVPAPAPAPAPVTNVATAGAANATDVPFYPGRTSINVCTVRWGMCVAGSSSARAVCQQRSRRGSMPRSSTPPCCSATTRPFVTCYGREPLAIRRGAWGGTVHTGLQQGCVGGVALLLETHHTTYTPTSNAAVRDQAV